jgi:2-polyprenyl-3-methyl-5-hydroxy-6-metoxy-1,4-benzoquinol methylase
MSVPEFYDDYVARQAAVGINARHRSILRLLTRFGLDHGDRVLEVGAGIGTLTELLAEYLNPHGSIVAMDLSPNSIAVAKNRLARFHNIELLTTDALRFQSETRFNVVVLPDVIEHIPPELHPSLFHRIASWLQDDGFALAHYPNPYHLEWVAQHRPQLLQVVDQPIHAHQLVGNAYAAGLYLDHYERYSIWVREGDYIVAVLKPSAGVGDFHDLPETKPSLMARARGHALRRGRPLIDRWKRRST